MAAKGYWIANNDIHDVEGLSRYRDANRDALNAYGAKFIVMHGQMETPEGTARTNWTLVEFPSYQAALDCYDDPAYQEAAKIRHASAEGDQSIVEGYDGPQDF